ncbi:hypothetical protein BC827DRAFT_255444 [Russula dissimulans]|nr:hypothetical protein BC827DRAFT_255444 [Russula dissimulans]
MSRPSKARHPVLNLGTFLFVGLFFASCVLEGYECQSPSDSSELPGHLDSSLPALSTTTSTVCTLTLFPTHFETDPPRLACIAWVDEGVTEVGMRVQYTSLFPTPLDTGPPRRAHMYCVDEGVTEERMRTKASQYSTHTKAPFPTVLDGVPPHERSFDP